LVKLNLVGVIGEQLAEVESIGWSGRIPHQARLDLRRQMDAVNPKARRGRFGGSGRRDRRR
jgi:hypothetical protein